MNVEHVTTVIHLNLCALQARIPWVGCIEDLAKLFKGLSSCLYEEEEDDGEFDADPADEDEVQLPADLLHTDRDTIGVDDHGDVEEEEVEAGALGPGAIL